MLDATANTLLTTPASIDSLLDVVVATAIDNKAALHKYDYSKPL